MASRAKGQDDRAASGPPPDDGARSLPHNLDAERSVLGAVLLSNAAYAKIGGALRPEHFYRTAHRMIWAAMSQQLDAPHGACDYLLLSEELTKRGQLDDVGGPVYLSALVDSVPRGTNVRYYADIVIGHANRRALIRESQKIMTAAFDGEADVDQLLADADTAVMRLRHGAADGSLRPLSHGRAGLNADLEYRFAHRGELMGVPTGFGTIDNLTDGWQGGDMIIVAARPSIGKTTFVLQSARAAAESVGRHGRQRRAAMFSLEMKELQLHYRMLSVLTGIPIVRLRGGLVPDHATAEWTAISEAQERMDAMGLHIDDSSSQTVSRIRGKCRELQAEGGLDIVIIDYVQLMAGELNRKGATRNDEVTDISRKLKVLAGDLDCPVVVLSQLNRASVSRFDPKPKMQDLRESGSLEQDADVIAFLHRKDHTKGGLTEFIIEKARNGPTGTAYLNIARETTSFSEWSGPLPDMGPTPEEKAAAKAKHAKTAGIKKRMFGGDD